MFAAAFFFAALAVAWVFWRGGGAPLDPEWVRYRDRFVSSEGRVIDTGRGGITTSEGQGFGMLLAVANNDRIAFDRIWDWTKQNLDKRDDGLFVWKWSPPEAKARRDSNNATDGDLLIAWALARAGVKWDEDAFVAEAKKRAAVIRSFQILAREIDKKFYLMPARMLFDRADGIVINPSYLVFPAFQEFQVSDPDWAWGQFTNTGLRVLEQARFGAFELPPDWLLVDGAGKYSLPDRFDRVSGYEAIRIPLYLIWANLASEDLLRPFSRAWTASRASRQIGVVFDLDTNDVKQRNQGAGFLAIERAVDCVLTGYPIPAALKLTQHDDYYSASLYLLTLAVLREKHPDCLSERD